MSALAAAGVAPQNGWIADYPITPDILGELEVAVADAADSGRLTVSRDEALVAFRGLAVEFDLAAVAAAPEGGDLQGEPPQELPIALGPCGRPQPLLQRGPARGHLLPSSTGLLLPVWVGALSFLLAQLLVPGFLHSPRLQPGRLCPTQDGQSGEQPRVRAPNSQIRDCRPSQQGERKGFRRQEQGQREKAF
jgi:hypothetical protein